MIREKFRVCSEGHPSCWSRGADAEGAPGCAPPPPPMEGARRVIAGAAIGIAATWAVATLLDGCIKRKGGTTNQVIPNYR